MDVPLYAIALAVFAVLYIAVGVFLAYTLVITLLIMFAYLAIRHGKLPENYPHGLGDTLITVIFIGVTWGIFIYLAPKPVPFIGNGLLYTPGANIPIAPVIAISLILSLVFLGIGAFVARDLPKASAGSGATAIGPENKPKQGVGA